MAPSCCARAQAVGRDKWAVPVPALWSVDDDWQRIASRFAVRRGGRERWRAAEQRDPFPPRGEVRYT